MMTPNYYMLMRIKALEILGNKCSLCNECDITLLEIDHIHSYRRSDGPRAGYALFKAIYNKSVNISQLQLLCIKCHKEKSRQETIIRSKNLKSKYIERQNIEAMKLLKILLRTMDTKTAIQTIESVIK